MRLAVAHTFALPAPPARVWERLADVPAVLECIPGTRVLGRRVSGDYEAAIAPAFGPVRVEFRGAASVQLDPAAGRAAITARGRDRAGTTRASAQLEISLTDAPGGGGTTAEIRGPVDFAGALAGVAYTGGRVVLDQIVSTFAANLAAWVASDRPVAAAPAPGGSTPEEATQ